MALEARYHDGTIAEVRQVACGLDAAGAGLLIADAGTAEPIDVWPVSDVFALPARHNELRLGATGRPSGARLVVSGYEQVVAARTMLPGLEVRRRTEDRQQARILGAATAALLVVIVAYVLGVPLLASRLVNLVPMEWEARLGNEAAAQIEAQLTGRSDFAVCDTDPQSVPNRAIARFADAVMQGTGSPFRPDFKVVRTDIVNAFALPGGHAYYFSALLDQTETQDEFAGVMAHELGHVVNRHGMQSLISNSATGLLIGFILGDMTGLSVAGGLGSALVDSHFSREDESQADAFAAAAARRVGFDPVGLPDLLDRIAKDDAMSATLAFLADHPLTIERRHALELLAAGYKVETPVFTDAEWHAIKAMCGPAKDG